MEQVQVETNRVKKPIRSRLRVIGPGTIITASFIGPGTVTTATKAGASFGYALLWAVVFSIVTTIILQEMAARLGIVSQKGLGEAIRDQFTHPLLKYGAMWFVMIAVGVGCAAYMNGDLTGTRSEERRVGKECGGRGARWREKREMSERGGVGR